MLEKSFSVKFDIQKYVILLLNLKRCKECYSTISNDFIVTFLDRSFSCKENAIFNLSHRNKKVPIKYKINSLSPKMIFYSDRYTISENSQTYGARVLLVQYSCSRCLYDGFLEVDIDSLSGNNFIT